MKIYQRIETILYLLVADTVVRLDDCSWIICYTAHITLTEDILVLFFLKSANIPLRVGFSDSLEQK